MKEVETKTICNVQRAKIILGARSDMAVYQMVQRRLIPFRKLGKRLLFIEEELLQFVDSSPGLTIAKIRGRD
jgi:hypothetical protein